MEKIFKCKKCGLEILKIYKKENFDIDNLELFCLNCIDENKRDRIEFLERNLDTFRNTLTKFLTEEEQEEFLQKVCDFDYTWSKFYVRKISEKEGQDGRKRKT